MFLVTVFQSTEDVTYVNQLILYTLFIRPLSETSKLWKNRKSSRVKLTAIFIFHKRANSRGGTVHEKTPEPLGSLVSVRSVCVPHGSSVHC